jgi:hypothetical protein
MALLPSLGCCLPKDPSSIIKDSSFTSTDWTANNVLPNGAVIQETLISFKYVQKEANIPVHVLHCHSEILNTILLEHSDHVTIYEKKNRPVDRARVASLGSLAHLPDLCDLALCPSGFLGVSCPLTRLLRPQHASNT